VFSGGKREETGRFPIRFRFLARAALLLDLVTAVLAARAGALHRTPTPKRLAFVDEGLEERDRERAKVTRTDEQLDFDAAADPPPPGPKKISQAACRSYVACPDRA
jgi:hypothetical protein